MNRNTRVVIAILAALLIIGGLLWVSYRPAANSGNSSGSGSSTSSSSTTQSGTTDTTPSSLTINYTGGGFSSPVYYGVPNDVVKIVNSSTGPLEFYSDPFTEHTDEPELNVGRIEQGSSATFVVTQKGHWGFHNQLSPSETGTLIIN